MTLNLDKTRADPQVKLSEAIRDPRCFPILDKTRAELPPGMAAEARARGLSHFGRGDSPRGPRMEALPSRPSYRCLTNETLHLWRKSMALLTEEGLDALLDLIHEERERRYAASVQKDE